MANLKFHIILLSMLAVGCATITDMNMLEKFEQTSDAFELAMRWSDFEMAGSFLKDQKNPELVSKIEYLKQFKITSYTVKRFIPSADKSQVLVIADMQFFKINSLIVKDISHRQLWEFDEEKKNWFLTTGLPDLK